MCRGKSAAIIPKTLFPGDLEVLDLAEGTEIELIHVPADAETGLIDRVHLKRPPTKALTD